MDAPGHIGRDPLSQLDGLSLLPAHGDDGQSLQRSLESDEAQARCIRLIDRLLVEIKAGFFDPDANRAGRFHKEFLPDDSDELGDERFSEDTSVRDDITTEVNRRHNEAENIVLSPDEPLEEGHITSSSAESEAGRVELEAPVRVFHPPSAPEGFRFVQNKRTKTLHLVDYKYPSGTCCGKLWVQTM